jgi:NDP-sugar pyrophosphorylase family protein
MRETSRDDLTLVVLAAGVGSRFGGLKQLTGFGPGGETLVEYSIFDALRAGFSRVVLVVRPETEAEFRESIGARIDGNVRIEYVHQRLDKLPAGWQLPPDRHKPWGTGHAVLASAEVVDGPFVIINADDFYGADAFAAAGRFLTAPPPAQVPVYTMVGFALAQTLPESGSVSRAVCRCDNAGWLQSIVEVTAISRSDQGGRYTDDSGTAHQVDGGALVSMNLWGFTPDIFPKLTRHFSSFLELHLNTPDAEHRLPDLVQELVNTGRARVKVLPSDSDWCGVTYQEDRSQVVEHLKRLVSKGVYPERLWE